MKKFFALGFMFYVPLLVANAQPGILDSSFGVNGKITTSVETECHASFLQRDGKILIGGTGVNFSMTRLLQNGSVDSSFGNSGIVVNTVENYSQTVTGIAVLQNGTIVTAAIGVEKTDTKNNSTDIILAKYLPNGSLDIDFGENGVAVIDFGYEEFTADMKMQEDGKIVLTGHLITNRSENENKVFTARFLESGITDEAFGESGVAVWDGGPAIPYGRSLIIQPDNKIVVAVSDNTTIYKIYLLRYLIDGSLDPLFGNGGVVVTDLPDSGNEFVEALALQADGKILAAGSGKFTGFSKDAQMVVVRYNTNGTPDENFGTGGATFIKFASKNAEAKSVAIQTNGKILISGRDYSDLQPIVGNFALARLDAGGLLDSTFGVAGKQITDFDGYDFSRFVKIQTDGKILSIGQREGDYSYAIARYYGDPVNQHPLIAKIKRWIRNHILNFESTNDETMAYYAIEKQTGTGSFKQVASIPANAANSYSYNLATAGTTATDNNYRIKGVAKNGGIVYSDVITDAATAVAAFKLYPNPAKHSINISTDKPLTLRLQNSSGVVLLTQKINGSAKMDISKLRPGIYYLVDAESGVSVRLVKE